MQEVNSLWEMLGHYFQSDIVFSVIIAALPWLIKDISKKQKIYLGCILFALMLCFNEGVFFLVTQLGEGETYYRLLWILPLGCIFAVVLIKIWDEIKDKWQKLLYILILGVAFFVYSSGTLNSWTKTDLYCVSAETMLVADIIDEHSGHKPVNVLDYSEALLGIRQYNANMILVDETVDSSFDFMFKYNLGNTSGLIINATIYNLKVEYICLEKEKNVSQMALLSGGAVLAGETENYFIYYFDPEEVEKMWYATEDWNLEVPITGVEYATLPGVEVPARFVYYADGHITLLDEALDPVESYMTEDAEFKSVEFEEFIVCAIDNEEGCVTAETVEKYEEVVNLNKPVILLLRVPMVGGIPNLEKPEEGNLIRLERKIMAGDSPVVAVYTTGYYKANKELLNKRVMQCVCIPTNAQMGVIINVKGE